MKAVAMADGIYKVGVNIEEKDYLFEGIWPIPDGVSINGYAIKGEKTAILDLTQRLLDMEEQYDTQLKGIGITPENTDYIIINHMEPDHSGHLKAFYDRNPNVQLYCTKKGAELVAAYSGITENVNIIKSGDTLDLGDGKELVFYEIPNVHWPETMATYEKSNKILFSCDAFGSYGSVRDDASFDDLISQEKHDFYDRESLRYYANIVAAFSLFVERALKALDGLEIKMIAPSHGIIWRDNPGVIIERYAKLAGYAKGCCEPEITVIWGSMYGHTREVLNSVIQGIRSENVPVHIFQVPQDDAGFILGDAWKSAGLVLGMPTYEYNMFPPMAHVIDEMNRKKFTNKTVFRFGSYGWSGGAQKELDTLTEKMKWNFMEPVEWQGSAVKEDFDKAYAQGKALAKAVKEKCSI